MCVYVCVHGHVHERAHAHEHAHAGYKNGYKNECQKESRQEFEELGILIAASLSLHCWYRAHILQAMLVFKFTFCAWWTAIV